MSVMLSIRPEWVEKILSGEKTIEVRKTRPKLEMPFKCFIYCTKPKFEHEDFFVTNAGTAKIRVFHGGGKVVAEFVCDEIYAVDCEHEPNLTDAIKGITAYRFLDAACMDACDLLDYLSKPDSSPEEYSVGYGWHVSDLKIYDEPKALWEFSPMCRHTGDCGTCQYFDRPKFECRRGQFKRPPQSWAYVEDNVWRE